jgi:hypothetical protein
MKEKNHFGSVFGMHVILVEFMDHPVASGEKRYELP